MYVTRNNITKGTTTYSLDGLRIFADLVSQSVDRGIWGQRSTSFKHHRRDDFTRRVQSYTTITSMPVVLERAEKSLIRQLVLLGQSTPEHKCVSET